MLFLLKNILILVPDFVLESGRLVGAQDRLVRPSHANRRLNSVQTCAMDEEAAFLS